VSELGELLELLYGARHSFRTARGVVRHTHSWRLTQEAAKRANARRRQGRGGSVTLMQLATSGESAEEPPDIQEETIRFWFEPPERLREEVEGPRPSLARTTVLDGELWWTYSPDWGATSNVGLSEEETSQMSAGGGEYFRPLLDPSGLPGALEIDSVDIDGPRLLVRARPRDDLDGFQRQMPLHGLAGADELELVVDRERGVVLRATACLDGQELSVTELEEIVFDEVFPEATFVFVPPPGEDVRPPEAFPRQYSLEEAAALVGFPVFEVPVLPEGDWRSHVHYSPPRERPDIKANVALFYHRANGRGSIILSQQKTGEGGFGWPGIHPDGPPLEELERDGVHYTACRADPEQGSGAAVTLERDGTALQLQSLELDVEALIELAASLRRVE
jgi:outer membrane lipoprotein-sorting protein